MELRAAESKSLIRRKTVKVSAGQPRKKTAAARVSSAPFFNFLKNLSISSADFYTSFGGKNGARRVRTLDTVCTKTIRRYFFSFLSVFFLTPSFALKSVTVVSLAEFTVRV